MQAGICNVGTKKGVTDQNIIYGVIGKTIPKFGRIHLGPYFGNRDCAGFLGGNSNSTTGDFSLGAQGHRVRGGRIAEPIGEMNVSGNHLELWHRLAAVGDDPYPYSAMRAPTLVFEGVQLAGT